MDKYIIIITYLITWLLIGSWVSGGNIWRSKQIFFNYLVFSIIFGGALALVTGGSIFSF